MQEIDTATDEALNVQHYGQNIVITMLVLTLLSSLFIVWFFVEKKVAAVADVPCSGFCRYSDSC